MGIGAGSVPLSGERRPKAATTIEVMEVGEPWAVEPTGPVSLGQGLPAGALSGKGGDPGYPRHSLALDQGRLSSRSLLPDPVPSRSLPTRCQR